MSLRAPFLLSTNRFHPSPTCHQELRVNSCPRAASAVRIVLPAALLQKCSINFKAYQIYFHDFKFILSSFLSQCEFIDHVLSPGYILSKHADSMLNEPDPWDHITSSFWGSHSRDTNCATDGEIWGHDSEIQSLSWNLPFITGRHKDNQGLPWWQQRIHLPM